MSKQHDQNEESSNFDLQIEISDANLQQEAVIEQEENIESEFDHPIMQENNVIDNNIPQTVMKLEQIQVISQGWQQPIHKFQPHTQKWVTDYIFGYENYLHQSNRSFSQGIKELYDKLLPMRDNYEQQVQFYCVNFWKNGDQKEFNSESLLLQKINFIRNNFDLHWIQLIIDQTYRFNCEMGLLKLFKEVVTMLKQIHKELDAPFNFFEDDTLLCLLFRNNILYQLETQLEFGGFSQIHPLKKIWQEQMTKIQFYVMPKQNISSNYGALVFLKVQSYQFLIQINQFHCFVNISFIKILLIYQVWVYSLTQCHLQTNNTKVNHSQEQTQHKFI